MVAGPNNIIRRIISPFNASCIYTYGSIRSTIYTARHFTCYYIEHTASLERRSRHEYDHRRMIRSKGFTSPMDLDGFTATSSSSLTSLL